MTNTSFTKTFFNARGCKKSCGLADFYYTFLKPFKLVYMLFLLRCYPTYTVFPHETAFNLIFEFDKLISVYSKENTFSPSTCLLNLRVTQKFF